MTSGPTSFPSSRMFADFEFASGRGRGHIGSPVRTSHLDVFFYSPTAIEAMSGLTKAARVGDLDEAIKLVSNGEDVNDVSETG